jgi:hypothetical protein
MSTVKKQLPQQPTSFRKTDVSRQLLTFSFRFFDHTDVKLCPVKFHDGYTQTLMQRLRDLSSWTPQEFSNGGNQTLRVHPHDWPYTARPQGFAHLHEQLRAYPSLQFSISANKYGRVHGILIDSTFYVIWLDQNHCLYPKK